ncbi:hypothetical protein BRADI_2g20698v3 [Brachypodium distachyon]|uniref:Uncharacterized protein n=1 Tax=Brachypodium distachyon TaxID=15368 RepID=A0A2K2D9M1_BRADI|nr:hypothetical protein BRADI_2g20698v3 [Brachypodium distachyon]
MQLFTGNKCERMIGLAPKTSLLQRSRVAWNGISCSIGKSSFARTSILGHIRDIIRKQQYKDTFYVEMRSGKHRRLTPF